ncbi:hypothetical protein HZ326_30326, partial [Fusarium oxysporum f. sp. albedinis]
MKGNPFSRGTPCLLTLVSISLFDAVVAHCVTVTSRPEYEAKVPRLSCTTT